MLYLSIVNVGQTFYAFGWESMLCEAGFFAAFLGPADVQPPTELNQAEMEKYRGAMRAFYLTKQPRFD